MGKIKLHWQILIAIVLAAIAGSITGTEASILGVTFVQIYDFLGTLFMNALRMIIVPLIMSSIIVGIANLGSGSDLGRLGVKLFSIMLLPARWLFLLDCFSLTCLALDWLAESR